MNTSIKMLPLPKWCYSDKHLHVGSGAIRKEVRAYSSAVAKCNVAARDAEIKALRVDVEAWEASHSLLTDTCHHFQACAKRLAEEIDWIKSQPEDDRMFAEIEAAAKASFHRHRTSCRGQVLTRADNYESHLVWATLEWAKRTNGAEQHAERLAEALEHVKAKLEDVAVIRGGHGTFAGTYLIVTEALRDHDQEGGDG